MKRMKRAVHAAVATFAMTASLVGVTATEASAINFVPCGNRTDLLKFEWHGPGVGGVSCLANGGQISYGPNAWVKWISTGNNRVQWLGDGRWQPATPIPKNTLYKWPNHPDGVRMEAIRIV
ncbi:hypothetical protein ACGH7X_41480 [Streptomyces sp. BBFR51]|uniref:hypothetical protein n=1 Tax=Streptomyces sp. BBFR51 TaxID=3372856 RepID=UPI0037DCA0D6